MTQSLDLGGEWTLRGWRENDWRRSMSFVRHGHERPDVGPLPMQIPGSVRAALSAAGLLPDPTHGTSSRDHEWVEHRHWTITRDLPADLTDVWDPDDGPAVLTVASLDGGGLVLVDDVEVARFNNAALPVEVTITDLLAAGARRVTVVMDHLPHDLGQVTWTSRVRDVKARYSYGWDWIPRLVSQQVAGPVTLHLGRRSLRSVQAIGDVNGGGEAVLMVRAEADGPVELSLPGGWRQTIVGDGAWNRLHVGSQPLWRPGEGGTVTLSASVGEQVHTLSIGFRSVRWLPCADAPPSALPWICEVNGERLFLAGVNWVPIRADYADVTEADYRVRMAEYRRIGITAFRVWGGAMMEQPLFYDLCDEYGFLVWQELPLCSSGLDNRPPEDEQFTTTMGWIAAHWADTLSHHPCLVLWGGGNELSEPRHGTEVPCGLEHPALARVADVMSERDPLRPFVPASPSGPSCWFDATQSGLGRHHDVHGPWEWNAGWDSWVEYWDSDDALMRSEVGFPGATPWDLLEACGLTGPTDTPNSARASPGAGRTARPGG